jgi:preprotein translocase subunit SecF
MDFAGKRCFGLLFLCYYYPGIVSIIINGLNFGIDFAGGNLIQVSFRMKQQ